MLTVDQATASFNLEGFMTIAGQGKPMGHLDGLRLTQWTKGTSFHLENLFVGCARDSTWNLLCAKHVFSH